MASAGFLLKWRCGFPRSSGEAPKAGSRSKRTTMSPKFPPTGSSLNGWNSLDQRRPLSSQAAEKCVFRPAGVKTPEEYVGFMSRLKARPTKLEAFSATCSDAEVFATIGE